MRIAVIFTGLYSDWYLYNTYSTTDTGVRSHTFDKGQGSSTLDNWQGSKILDFYCVTFLDCLPQLYKDCEKANNDIIPIGFKQQLVFNEVMPDTNRNARFSHIDTHFVVQGLNMAKAYSSSRGYTYDAFVLLDFSDILLQPLTEHSSRGSSTPLVPTSEVYLSSMYLVCCIDHHKINSVRMISDSCIRVSDDIHHVYSLDEVYNTNKGVALDVLHHISDKVCTPEELKDQPYSKYIFLIPNVVHTSGLALSYNHRRSVFTHNERFDQLVSQLRSIEGKGIEDTSKHSLSGISVYILEGSLLTFDEIKVLSGFRCVVKVVMFCFDKEGNEYANLDSNKNKYEVYALRKVLGVCKAFDWVFKFGGRYSLLPFFDIKRYQRDRPVFKVLTKEVCSYGPLIENIIYSIPYSYRDRYLSIYTKVLDAITKGNSSVERELYNAVVEDGRYSTIDSLGILGRDAILGCTTSL